MTLRDTLGHELRALLRSPLRTLALVVVLGAGLGAIAVGLGFVARWQQALVEAAQAERAQQAEALGWFERGEAGPADRPWVDVRQPFWAERSTGTQLGKAPAPLAAFALGVADTRPLHLRVTRTTDPFDADLALLTNPERLLAGNFDLSFVLTYLVPLLVLLLGFDLGGYERDRGLLPLVQVQAGSLARWLRWRLGVQGLGALVVVVGLCGVAGVASGALVEAFGAWGRWTLLAALYTLGWLGVLALVVAAGRGSAWNALALGLAWLAVCLLVPAAVGQAVRQAHPAGFGTEATVGLRGARAAIYEGTSAEALPALYARYPELAQTPAAQRQPLPEPVARLALDAAWLAVLEEELAKAAAKERERSAFAERFVWLSPVLAFQRATHQLAGNEVEGDLAFRADALALSARKQAEVLRLAFGEQTVDRAGFEHLVALDPGDRAYPGAPGARAWAALGVWAAGLLGLGLWRLGRVPGQSS